MTCKTSQLQYNNNKIKVSSAHERKRGEEKKKQFFF